MESWAFGPSGEEAIEENHWVGQKSREGRYMTLGHEGTLRGMMGLN